MSSEQPRNRYPVVRFAKVELVLGPKVWIGCGVAAAIVVLGVLVTPSNGWAGVGIGVAAILGTVLGALFQTTPRSPDHSAKGTSAVRGLLNITEDIENAKVLVTQLISVTPKNVRLSLGLLDVQDRLEEVRVQMYSSMAEWDAVAPGSTQEIGRLRGQGKAAFALLAREMEIDD